MDARLFAIATEPLLVVTEEFLGLLFAHAGDVVFLVP